MSYSATAPPFIVETDRGPCIAGRRTTIYVILEHLNSGCDREFIKERLLLSDQQLDAAIEYLQRHREEVERDYANILRLSEERRQHYDKLYRERAPYDPNLPLEERIGRMRRDLAKWIRSRCSPFPASKGSFRPITDNTRYTSSLRLFSILSVTLG